MTDMKLPKIALGAWAWGNDGTFGSNGGGGLGQSVTAISKLAPNAHVGQGLSIYYSGGSDMPRQVADWLAENA